MRQRFIAGVGSAMASCHRPTVARARATQPCLLASIRSRPFSVSNMRKQDPPPARTAPTSTASQSTYAPRPAQKQQRTLTSGLDDPLPDMNNGTEDWTRSFAGLSHEPFKPETAAVLMAEVDPDDIEIKPDGIVYLPEIKYRRIMNKAFGPGGWGLAPRGETIVTAKLVTREYGLVCGGRLVSIARGEMTYFDADGIPTATEGCKSNALMRCCKDLGIASELWDPRFIRRFLADKGKEMFVEHAVTKKRRKYWLRKDDKLVYPWKEASGSGYGGRS